MQKPVEPQPIHIQRIGSEFAGQFLELLLNSFWDAHIKNALHQHLNGEEVGIDGF